MRTVRSISNGSRSIKRLWLLPEEAADPAGQGCSMPLPLLAGMLWPVHMARTLLLGMGSMHRSLVLDFLHEWERKLAEKKQEAIPLRAPCLLAHIGCLQMSCMHLKDTRFLTSPCSGLS